MKRNVLIVYDPRGSVCTYFNAAHFVQEKLIPLLKTRFYVIEKKIRTLQEWTRLTIPPGVTDVYILFHANPFKTKVEPGTIPRKQYYEVLRKVEDLNLNMRYPNSSKLDELVSFKAYTSNFQKVGIPIVPTTVAPTIDRREVDHLFKQHERVVVKLGGSTNTRHIFVFRRDGDYTKTMATVKRTTGNCALPLTWLIQPYVKHVAEIKIHFIKGKYYKWWALYSRMECNGTLTQSYKSLSDTRKHLKKHGISLASILARANLVSKTKILPYLQTFQTHPILHFRTDWFIVDANMLLLNEVEVWGADFKTVHSNTSSLILNLLYG